MSSRIYNHGAIIGMEARHINDSVEGIITASLFEDNKHILQINDEYEIVIGSCEIVFNLINGDSFVRIFCPSLF